MERKLYIKPAITHELTLETQAGSSTQPDGGDGDLGEIHEGITEFTGQTSRAVGKRADGSLHIVTRDGHESSSRDTF